ncbi:MAG TPA: hypothetical protein VIW46_02725, partial [Acidimicrobiia bacterium]
MGGHAGSGRLGPKVAAGPVGEAGESVGLGKAYTLSKPGESVVAASLVGVDVRSTDFFGKT